jgi:uncharacterized protein (TIGR03435 family)
LRKESRESPVYVLIQSKTAKLEPGEEGKIANLRPGSLEGDGVSMTELAGFVGGLIDRPVLNETGLSGVYKVKLTYECPQLRLPSNL